MDTIGNMLISIINAGNAKKALVLVPYSSLKFAIAQVLLKKGYIKSYEKKNRTVGAVLEIELLYNEDGLPKIRGIKRVSKPSRRVYCGVKSIYSVRQGSGVLLLSTPKGILTGYEAKKELVGGEALFELW